jgi:hypothetical protein
MKKYIPLLASLALFPVLASAQLRGVEGLIERLIAIVRLLVGLVGALSLLVFMWGLVKFIFKVGGDEDAIEGGKNLMKWGLVALFVMVSVWGIIGWFQRDLGLPVTTGGGGTPAGSINPIQQFGVPS